MAEPRYDEIGYWSELKIEIVRKYASAYSTILSKQRAIRAHVYIDGFAGAGEHVSKTTGEIVAGSPKMALEIDPPFNEFHFIDLEGGRAENLKRIVGVRHDVHVYQGDCNEILINRVFERARYEEYRRALCLLDPYGLNLDWDVIRTAGNMRSIEIFLNFMVMDMNRNVLWRDPDKVSPKQIDRMNRFWGDESWTKVAYRTDQNLFKQPEKTGNEDIAKAFQARLRQEAGFAFVPDPIPMRNSTGATVYYLFFASPNRTGSKIVGEIFAAYRDHGRR